MPVFGFSAKKAGGLLPKYGYVYGPDVSAWRVQLAWGRARGLWTLNREERLRRRFFPCVAAVQQYNIVLNGPKITVSSVHWEDFCLAGAFGYEESG
jgi:hypothetical protein